MFYIVLGLIFFLFIAQYFEFEKPQPTALERQPCFNKFNAVHSKEVLQCPVGFEANPENGAQFQHIKSPRACRRILSGDNILYKDSDYKAAHACPHLKQGENLLNQNLLKSPTASTYNNQ